MPSIVGQHTRKGATSAGRDCAGGAWPRQADLERMSYTWDATSLALLNGSQPRRRDEE